MRVWSFPWDSGALPHKLYRDFGGGRSVHDALTFRKGSARKLSLLTLRPFRANALKKLIKKMLMAVIRGIEPRLPK